MPSDFGTRHPRALALLIIGIVAVLAIVPMLFLPLIEKDTRQTNIAIGLIPVGIIAVGVAVGYPYYRKAVGRD